MLARLFGHVLAALTRAEEAMVSFRCSSAVTAGDRSRFYKQASVVNMQHDRGKIRVGVNSHIRGELLVFPYGGDIQIGDSTYIGEGTKLWSGEKIVIGSHVGIAHNVNLIDFAHETDHLERAAGFEQIFATGHPKDKGNIPTAPIVVGDYAVIYPNSTISRGVRIGEGAVISAGSVVLSDVPPFTLMLGNPARPMKVLRQ